MLHTVGQQINAIHDLKELFDALYEHTRQVIHTDKFFLALYREEDGLIDVHAIDREVLYTTTREPGPLTQWVITHQQGVFSQDLTATLLPVEPDFILVHPEQKVPASLIVLPLVVEDKVVGVISVQDYRPYAFDSSDEQLLSIIAGQAAVAIKNIRLFTRRVEELEALNQIDVEIVSAVSTFDLDQLFEQILDKARELTKAQSGSLYLYDETTDELQLKTAEDVVAPPSFPPQGGIGITGWVAQHKVPLRVDDTRTDERYVSFIPDMHSELAVPMLRGERLIGVLNVESPGVGAFDEDDERLLKALAAQAVSALKYAEQNAKLDTLITINQELSATLDSAAESKVLAEILEKGCDLLKASDGKIMLLNLDTNQLVTKAERGLMEGHIGYTQEVDEGLIGLAVRERRPIKVDDVTAPEWADVYVERLPNTRSELAVPLILPDGELLGVLNVESPLVAAFNNHDERLLMALADQALIALHNARQHESELALQERESALKTMVALGDSAWEIAHRVGNQLGLIKAWGNDIWDEIGKDNQIVNKRLEDVIGAAGTVLTLSGDLLVAVEEQRDPSMREKKDIPVQSILHEAYRSCSVPAVEFAQVCSDPDLAVYADARIFGAFANLCINAVQALPETGLRRIEFRVRLVGRMVEFLISDTGGGIPQAHQERIFNLLYTTKKNGTGFGLWSAKWRIVDNDGDIGLVWSEIGKGSTFRVLLPAYRGTWTKTKESSL